MGENVPINDRDFPSLWAAVAHGGDEVLESLRLTNESQAETIVQLEKRLANLERQHSEAEVVTNQWQLAVEKGFAFASTELEDLGRDMDLVKSTLKGAELKGGGNKKKRGARIQDGFLFRTEQPGGDDDSEDDGRDGDTQETLCDFRTRLSRVEGVLATKSGGDGSGGPPSFGDLGLASIDDLAAWVLENKALYMFGLLVDAPAVLSFKRSDYMTTGESLANMKRANDVGLSLLQARVLTSFQNILPAFFGKGSECEGSSLPALRKYSAWEADNGTGAKFRMEKALPLIQKQLNSYIGQVGQPTLRELARQCLSHSILFLYGLSDYMSRTGRALKAAEYEVDKVWSIVSRQVLRIFEDMGRARACAVDLSPPGKDSDGGGYEDGFADQHQNAAISMWAVLKTHDVMEEYMMYNFEDHPSIAAENVRFLTYHFMEAGDSDSSAPGLKQLQKKVDGINTEFKQIKLQCEKVSTKVDNLEKKG